MLLFKQNEELLIWEMSNVDDKLCFCPTFAQVTFWFELNFNDSLLVSGGKHKYKKL